MHEAPVAVRNCLAILLLAPACMPEGAGAHDVERVAQAVVGGVAATTCMWPSCVFGRGCSATLVHPRLTTTAAHCVQDNQMDGVANIGEAAPFVRTVPRQLCRRPPQYTRAGETGAYDIAFCTLREPIEDVPIVPVLSACESEQMIQPGKSVVIAGFGAPNSGRKFVGRMVITSVRNGAEVFLRGEGMTAGSGDSGGPGYLQMPDGTWRTFGVASRASGRNVAIYTLISAHLPWLEKESGIDLTPCHGPSGGWEGGPGCDRFPTDPGGTANGTWADLCQASPVARPMPSCSPEWQPGDGGPLVPPRGDAGRDGSAPLPPDGSPADMTGDTAPPPADAGPAPATSTEPGAPPGAAPPPAPAAPPGSGGSSGAPAASAGPPPSDRGCACALGTRPGRGALPLLVALAVLVPLGRRRPSRSGR
jgi:hypothetical protein